jgi:hypothetical protein
MTNKLGKSQIGLLKCLGDRHLGRFGTGDTTGAGPLGLAGTTEARGRPCACSRACSPVGLSSTTARQPTASSNPWPRASS